MFKTALEKEMVYSFINSLGLSTKAGKILIGATDKISMDLGGLATGLYSLSLYSQSAASNYTFIFLY